MNRRTFIKTVPALAVLSATTSTFAQDKAPAQDLQPIALPQPETDGGKSVLAALQERKTNRNIRADKLPPQMLSNLLWAAFGVNRPSAILRQSRAGPPPRPATRRRSTCTSPCRKGSTSTRRSPTV